MIAKLKRTQSNAQQNTKQTLNSTIDATRNHQQNYCLRTDSSLSYLVCGWGCINTFYCCKFFAIDYVVVKSQTLFISQGGSLCLSCLCARLFICALLSAAGKGLTYWLSFVVYNCELVTFPLVSWARCGT